MTKKITPFLKWVGGKSRLMPQIVELFPKNFDRYLEPFVGAGAIAINQLSKGNNVLINDANQYLICCYRCLRDEPEKLLWELSEICKDDYNTETYYYDLRKRFNSRESPLIKQMAEFIYLNKVGFNGLFRVNSSGGFNVPFGRYKNPTLVDVDNFFEVSKLLQSAVISFGDYQDLDIFQNDFVYLDPPYDQTFNGYDIQKFSQARLKEWCDGLSDRWIDWMQSNSDTPYIRDLYKGYIIKEVKVNRTINSDKDKRGAVTELLISNY